MKNFDSWNVQKRVVDTKLHRPFFKEREIYFARLGENVGNEQSGKGDHFLRPVLIVKKFNNAIFWGIPLTKTQKQKIFYYHFSFLENVSSVAIISQLKLIDAKRLERKIGNISKTDFEAIKKIIREFLKPDDS